MTPSVTPRQLWTGKVLSGLATAFLLFDSFGKFMKPVAVVEGTMLLGYPETVITGLGVTLLTSTLLYLYPRTAVVGAILLTGYLGGAIATHVRVGNSWLTHILFPVYLGVMLWGGLVLREARLRVLLPWNR